MESRLASPCRYIQGVGPGRAAALERLGVRTVLDLLLHLPRRYFDRSAVVPLRALRAGEVACVRVRLESVHARTFRRGRSLLVATVADDTGTLRVVWYNVWARSNLHPGEELLLAGPVALARGRLEMRMPEWERLADGGGGETLHGGRIVPLYPLTQGISQKWMRTVVHRALDWALPEVHEVLPEPLCSGLPERAAAFRAVHFPETSAEAARARDRFALEELFFMQLLLARRKARAQVPGSGIRMPRERGLHERYLGGLPFRLTAAQVRVLDEILADLESGCSMRRLVQGDVGAGKTVLANAALLAAAGNGWQGAFMAPTETLAVQHAERLAGACAALGVRFAVLVGSMGERDKEAVRARMAQGDVDLVVGTHALIQEGVRWARLGLAVVDEQQRFGVLQRAALQEGGGERPHVLVLTATPIPRSLALTYFGDLDVSRLDEKPPGRRPVGTRVVPAGKQADMLDFVRRTVEGGRQGYVVLPIIEESDELDLRAATVEYERLRGGPLAGLRLGLLHGRLPAGEKDALMRAFRRGDLQLLVCTSIVEVGVDVANATIMIVHHPDRFGLAQLHQLRGRVGRGAEASWCFLVAEAGAGDATLERLRAFAATEDGFRIAELDLERRGPGDFAGTRQHGLPALRVADLWRDQDLLVHARAHAIEIVRLDPDLARPEHRAVRAHLDAHWNDRAALAEIG
jgi:ATP-dependent DNA helicase RecG